MSLNNSKIVSRGGNTIKIDWKCEWDLPKYCEIKDDIGYTGDPFEDEDYLNILPEFGFFKKLKDQK